MITRASHTYENGITYSGDFMIKLDKKNNCYKALMHGWGEWKNKLGDTYEGNFAINYFDGKGKYKYFFNKSSYEGEFKYSRYNGKGTLRLPNGDCYEGKWDDE